MRGNGFLFHFFRLERRMALLLKRGVGVCVCECGAFICIGFSSRPVGVYVCLVRALFVW